MKLFRTPLAALLAATLLITGCSRQSSLRQKLRDTFSLRTHTEDIAQLRCYARANAALPPSSSDRVVFFGDSTTLYWLDYDPAFFQNVPYLNRGVAGQSSSGMLLRFRQDVLNLHPQVVVLLAGINDILGGDGPTALADTEANISSMLDLARAHGIRVVLASVLPIGHHYNDADRSRNIQALNRWLANTCSEQHCIYLDYASTIAAHGGMDSALSDDGLHPNKNGYVLMAPLAKSAIAQATNNIPTHLPY
jgi:acyl-CoA thioesterase-1